MSSTKLTTEEEITRKAKLADVIAGYHDRMQAKGLSQYDILGTQQNMATQRLEKICALGISPGDTVLDIGCGYKWLAEYIPQAVYKSLDIIEEFNPDIIADYLAPEYDIPQADWIVTLGTLNHNYGPDLCNYKLARVAIEKMLTSARRGIAVDFMSSRHPSRETGSLFYYNLDAIRSIVQEIGIVDYDFLHDYSVSEFMLICRTSC